MTLESMEQGNINQESGVDYETFAQEMRRTEKEAFDLLDAHLAYLADERDKNGNLKSIKIVKNDGTVVFFKDVGFFNSPSAEDKGN